MFNLSLNQQQLARAVFQDIGHGPALKRSAELAFSSTSAAMLAFDEQRELMLAAARLLMGKPYVKPFRALRDLFSLHGFKFKPSAGVDADTCASLEFDSSAVLASSKLVDAHGMPRSEHAAVKLRWALARELGRLRFDPKRAGLDWAGAGPEIQGDLFASVFLVPRLEFLRNAKLVTIFTSELDQQAAMPLLSSLVKEWGITFDRMTNIIVELHDAYRTEINDGDVSEDWR